MAAQDWLSSFLNAPDEKILRLFIILFFIVPGLTHIYVFETQLFYSLDIIKILFLSLIFSVPFMLISLFYLYTNSLKHSKTEKKIGSEKNQDADIIAFWAPATVSNYYLSLLTFFVIKYFITVYTNFWLHVIIINLIVFGLGFLEGLIKGFRERKAKK